MKHIVYKYDDSTPDEREFDSHGTHNFERGDIVSRHGASWKIDSIEYEDDANRKLISTWWVYLTRVRLN